jgi:hypothetical protein
MNKAMRIAALVAVFLAGHFLHFQIPSIVHAQIAPKSDYTPTHEQYLELQVAQKDAQLAEQNLIDTCGVPGQRTGILQQAAKDSYNTLMAKSREIAEANKWPSTVVLVNPDTLQYVDTAKKAEEKK